MPAKWEKMLAVFGQFCFFFIFWVFLVYEIRAHAMDQTLIFRYSLSYFFPLFRFLYDGARIQDDDTPASLDMEDNGVFKDLFHACNR